MRLVSFSEDKTPLDIIAIWEGEKERGGYTGE